MGINKDKEIEAEDRWQSIAASKGFKCAQCGEIIPRSELPAWSSSKTKFCGRCQHMHDKDD